jgi:hypothetical protein
LVEQMDPGSVPIGWQVKVYVELLKTVQSESDVHPGKQMYWLFPFSTQYVGLPALSGPPQSLSTVHDSVHHKMPLMQLPSVQSVEVVHESPMRPVDVDVDGALQMDPDIPLAIVWQVVPG